MNENSSEKAKRIRDLVCKIGSESGQSAHFGGALSIVDILTVLYFNIMKISPSDPYDKGRDRFVLSKGHGFLGLLATLNEYGLVADDDVSQFQSNGGRFIAHPVKDLSCGIEASTGSLGQGISYAIGMAEALRRLGSESRVFCLLGDGECNEGSVYEALRFLLTLGLKNCVPIIDANGHQNDGSCAEILDGNLAGICRGIGFRVYEIDGHDHSEIRWAIEDCLKAPGGVVVARTIKGFGFDLMQDNNDWHHNRLTARALNDLICK